MCTQSMFLMGKKKRDTKWASITAVNAVSEIQRRWKMTKIKDTSWFFSLLLAHIKRKNKMYWFYFSCFSINQNVKWEKVSEMHGWMEFVKREKEGKKNYAVQFSYNIHDGGGNSSATNIFGWLFIVEFLLGSCQTQRHCSTSLCL